MKELILKYWKYILAIIFVLAVCIRFLYFPNNIYFGFDQARDAFKSQDILKGDIQIVGPSTSIEGLYHGVLYYYLIAPVYLLSDGDPRGVAIFLRVANAIGVVIMFLFALILFKKPNKPLTWIPVSVGIVAAILFAFSFEQTQFSIYMGNPSLASLSVTLIFFFLSLVIFQKKWWGLPLALLSYGFSIQFEFALFYLIVPILLILGIFRRVFLELPLKAYFLTFVSFIFSVSTFIIAELKYDFRTLRTLTTATNESADRSIDAILTTYGYVLSLMNRLNLFGELPYKDLGLLVLGVGFTLLVWKLKDFRKQLLVLAIWFFALLFVYIIGGGSNDTNPLYYINIGIAPSLLLFTSLCIVLISEQNKLLSLVIFALILFANTQMITKYNPHSTVTNINVQQGMLLSDQLKILDIIYTEAKGQPFAVKALTMPLNINTTWSYLFEWYGKKKYNALPIWSGTNAIGYPGNLPVVDKQSELPAVRYSITEPTRGINSHDIEGFNKTEEYFTKLEWEKQIGNFKLQKRSPIE